MWCLSPQTRIIALDLETTGLNKEWDRVVELAAVCWQDGQETGHFQTLVNPGRPIPLAARAIHGISDAMVREMPPIADVLADFLAFCDADVLVAHNANFDLGFLRAECARIGLTFHPRAVADSCDLARRFLPGCPNYRLETLKIMLGLGKEQSHRALDDARDCLAIYLHCMERASTGDTTPITPPALSPRHALLFETLNTGTTVWIEYQDGRGRLTQREIRPMVLSPGCVQAYCLLRHETRHFNLDRIVRVWRD